MNNQWPGGFGVEIVVRNTGTVAITGWRVNWTFPNGQTITDMWNGTRTQTGANVTVVNVGHNGNLSPNASTNFGFNGSWSGANGLPTNVTCTPV